MYLPVLLAVALAAPCVVFAKDEPCAHVTSLVEDANQSKTSVGVPLDLAHECLLSMPFDSGRAVTFLSQLRKTLEFQSTVDILKNPPSGYMMPPTDLLGGVDSVINKVQNKTYSSQFEMDLDLSLLIQSAYDGHLTLDLCSQTVFQYQIDLPLVSVSTDGLALPQVYTLNDSKLLQAGSTTVSALVSINDIDVAQYLESYALSQSLQDRDAQYNRVFPALARSVTNTPVTPNGIWSSTNAWTDDARLSLTFANGSVTTIERIAVPAERFFSYQNGTELFNIYCLPQDSSSSSLRATAADAEQASDIPGLPNTTWSTDGGSVSGYFSNAPHLQDTGIIFLPTFASNPQDVAGVVTTFLQNATAAGKKKILIDVTANPGGYMTTGIDVFRIFFPDAFPYTATRFRAHETAKYLTMAYSRSNTTDSSNIFAYRQMVTPDQKSGFGTWEDLYGPHEILDSASSSLLANFNFTTTSTKSFPINGFGPVPLNPRQAPFSAEDIAIITDGDCVSTCAFFVKLMKRVGVRTIVFGGRPKKAPMQSVGGVKGGQSLQINYINGYIQQAEQLIARSMNSSSPLLTPDQWRAFNASSPSLAPSLAWGGSVNLRNEYDPDDNQTPLQFVYEAAECRLFYTVENYLELESTWGAAAKAMFGDGECVEGSMGGKGSLDSS
ncbi:uncharacterized protein PFLUO_LOCUS3267 [Penicillium psychrofluorescens]|uniref:uncharacterized protein n=1 Tax=Penicillium psychrofluorescens TaxID=3158075 RepID=UPI003CCCA993